MMSKQIHRRNFLGTAAAVGAGIGLAGFAGNDLFAKPAAKGAPNAAKLGWRLGCQAYSFNRFTFFEAVDKVASLGLKVIEAYPGQRLSKQHSNVKFNESMSSEVRKEVKKKLEDSGVKLVNFGVGGHSRKTFEFAKDMGIETVVSEPAPKAFDEIDKLCEEYKINLAIHNHPKNSRYWNYKTVLEVCKDRSKRIGACADTGHWMRSDIKPVEAIKALEGRIISFHFKDLHKFGRGAHDVPWGTGKADVKAILTEVKRQRLKAVFSVEYEYHWTTSLPEIAKCVEYFDKVAAELA